MIYLIFFYNFTIIDWFFFLILFVCILLDSTALFSALMTPKLKPDPNYYTNELPSLTVIIPSRNESKIIKKCLDNISKQKYDNLKVHVAINNSTKDQVDKTISIVESCSENFSYKDYGKMKEDWVSGKVWVLNEVLTSLKDLGDYILFLDADVNLKSELSLATVIHEFQRRKKYSIISLLPDFKCRSFTEKLVLYMIPSTLNLMGFINDLLFRGRNKNLSHITGWFLFLKKSELDEINKKTNQKGLEPIKYCPYSDDIATGRLFIHHKKRIAHFFGGKIIQNEMFSTRKKALIGMRRFGSNTYGAMSTPYKFMGFIFILLKAFPYLFIIIYIMIMIFLPNLFSIYIFLLAICVVCLSLISEYIILYRCDIKGIIPFFSTPLRLLFYIWGFWSNVKKKPKDYLTKYHSEVR